MKKLLISLILFLLSILCFMLTTHAQSPVSDNIPNTATISSVILPGIETSTVTIETPKKEFKPKVPLSGIILTPTAYRGKGENSIGLGLDFNAAYYIGRLYGKNTFDWTLEKKNYIDRVGVWLLMADAKMLIQTEGKFRPAMAVGVCGTFQFRDAPQPDRGKPGVSVKIDSKNTDNFANAYMVISKRPHPRLIFSTGYSDGESPRMIYQFSEFLSKEAINQSNDITPLTTPVKIPESLIFGGIIWFLKPNYPVSIEFLIPQGAPQKPRLINLHLGSILKLNFELSYLKFEGGWDLLGMFQFRYSYFPK